MASLAELAIKADAYKALRDKRLELSKQVEVLKEEEESLKAALIDTLQAEGVNGVEGKLCRISLSEATEPVVQDWQLLQDHIQTTGNFELLQRRLGTGAVKERWADGVEVAGVGRHTAYKLSLRKV